MFRRLTKVSLAQAPGNLPVLVLLVLTAAVPVLSQSVASAAEKPKSVLLLFSEESNLPPQVIVDQALRSTLKNGSPVTLEVYSEYLDSFRTRVDDYEKELVGLLRRKYEGRKFDLIIAVSTTALRVLLKNQPEIFPDTPIVFLVLDQRNVAGLNLGPNVTGVWGKADFKSNLDLALARHPNTRKVVGIAGVSEWDKNWTAEVRQDFRAYEGNLEISYLIGLTIAEQQQALASLPEHTIVFLVSSSRDNAGNNHSNLEVLRQISPASSAPIYGATDAQLGLGIVGGSLLSFEALGAQAAGLGLRVLAGEKPQAIAPHGVPNVFMFDWRELRRWGIDESRLPAGSIVRNRELSAWQVYKWRIIGAVALIILEALLISWLLLNRSRRRQAEAENERLAQLAEAERRRLDEVVSNVPGIVWETRFEADGKTRKTYFVNNYVEQMLGYSVDEWLSTPNFGLTVIADEDRERVARETETIFESGKEGVLQFRWMAKDGRALWVVAQMKAIRDETGQSIGLRGVTMDITDRIKAEAALSESEERYRNVVETQTELICRYLPDSTLTFVNDAYCRFFGQSREELIGTKFIEVIPENARAAALSHVASLIENPRIETYEHEVVRPNGERGWQQWIDHVVESSNGHGLELQGIGRDITKRRRAEEDLRLSETRFSTMADSAPIMIWISGPDKLCTYFNQGWLNFTGRTMEQELGSGWTHGVYSKDYARCLEVYESAFDRRESFQMEYRLRHHDGSFRWIYDSGTARFSSEGNFLGYIGSCIEISDRKEAEEALQMAHEEVYKLKNQLQAENIYLQEEIKLAHNVAEIIGESNVIRYVLFKIEQVAETDTTVLILGETGTGKELVARAIHTQSLRKDRPLIKVNCAALSANLIESELFGHEKGAFTGATTRKMGRFELADGATIFLDEIGELPLDLQPKLLRVIQEGELERLGSAKTIKVDVRIIAATNRNLKLEVGKGTFREDLWYRLNVFPITVPPLRQRKEDITEMVEHFVGTFSKKVGKAITSISAATLRNLQEHSWPGNVRELANVIERGVIIAQGSVLHIADQLAQEKPVDVTDSNQTLEQVEKEHIAHVLDQTSWRIEGPGGAAKILGLNPSTLRTRMQKLGIHRDIRSFSQGSGMTS